MPQDPPTGLVTLVFTDMERSSDLWQEHGARFQAVLDQHNRLLREAAAASNGFEVKTVGDAFFLAFPSAPDALRFAVAAQEALRDFDWPSVLAEVPALRIRIGVHTGEPLLIRHPSGAFDYFGPVVNRVARVEACGHGGQVVVTQSTYDSAMGRVPEGVSFEDQGVHRLKGVGEEHLWQLLHPGLPAEFPPLRTLDPQRHNLPRAVSPYVGREEELQAWLELLRQPSTRLVSLLGFGGLGKTRSALQLAELLVEDFAQGVWWVELEEARDVEGALQRIAMALRLAPQKETPIRDQISGFLKERKLLLVLDNGEQIEKLSGLVSDLLNVAPGLRILATSRRPLDVRQERRIELRPLPVAEAERLFEESARRGREDFALTSENRADVAELCRQLEGVPLAIELAASRIVGMTPREMLARLDQQFRLLQTRSPDLPPRQRALRGAIDWSYDLLPEEDRELFAQLSVFAGGFEMAAAEEICDAFDVFEGVMELRKSSLLQAETDLTTQQTRFRMLRSVRSYAAEKRAELPDEGRDFLEKHAQYFLGFAESRIRKLSTEEAGPALTELRLELENLRSALDWWSKNGPRELCSRLAAAVYVPLYRLGLWSDARRVLEVGLDAASQDDGVRRVRAELETAAASILDDSGDFARARAHAETALALRREDGEPAALAETLNVLGLIRQHEDNLDAAGACFQEALDLLDAGDALRRGKILHNLAYLHSAHGDWKAAEEGFEAALQARRQTRERRGEAETLVNLAAVYQVRAVDEEGDAKAARLERAEELYTSALQFFREAGDRYWEAVVLHNLGELAYEIGQPEEAVGSFVRAERLFRELAAAPASRSCEWLERIRQELAPERFAELSAAAT